jgi:hypothetical protein
MKKMVQVFCILSLIVCTVATTDAIAQKKGGKKGENVDWAKVNELLSYHPVFMQELCCDCGPKTIEDILVGTTAIDGLIKNACKVASRDMEITKKMEFIKIQYDSSGADGIPTVNITDGGGKKITALAASKQLLDLSKQAIGIAAEAQSLIDKKDAAQKEIEDASFLKKGSLTRGLGRGVDILKTVISESGKQVEKIQSQVNALTMLKDY